MMEETSIMNTKLHYMNWYTKNVYIYNSKTFAHVLEFMLWLVNVIYDINYTMTRVNRIFQSWTWIMNINLKFMKNRQNFCWQKPYKLCASIDLRNPQLLFEDELMYSFILEIYISFYWMFWNCFNVFTMTLPWNYLYNLIGSFL